MSEPIDWARVPYRTLERDKRAAANVALWIKDHERQGHVVRRSLDHAAGAALFEAYLPPAGTFRTLSLDYLDIETQISALSRTSTSVRPWRAATIKEALGVPAIHRAVTLISNTTGALSMNAYRKGEKLEASDRPQLIIRPDPFRIPRDFYRDTAYNMSTRGEAIWWITNRDSDGNATSLRNLDPGEVSITDDPDDPRRPVVEWRQRIMPLDDIRHITLLREPGTWRGFGPLQVCTAAVSIAVESQEWAANFFAAGGYPNIWIKAAGDLSGSEDEWSTVEQTDDGATSEIERLKLEWISTAPNTPKVTDEGIIDVKQFDPNPQGAQMLEARDHQNGDAARMFGIPGSLLDYRAGGSNLTYQNLEQEMTKFLRTCLWPYYLEAIEQTMSDLLPRSTVARFNVDAINRADIKTRYEVYQLGVASGVLTPEVAQMLEGFLPGDVENAPVPQPIPRVASLPDPSGMRDVRCPRCQRLVVRASGAVEGWCRHCKAAVAA